MRFKIDKIMKIFSWLIYLLGFLVVADENLIIALGTALMIVTYGVYNEI